MPDTDQQLKLTGDGDAASPISSAPADRKTELSETTDELERLRRMQTELERRQTALTELSRKRDAYQEGKREILQSMAQALDALRQESGACERAMALFAEARKTFETRSAALEAIDDSRWEDGKCEEDLNRALGEVDDAAAVYARLMGKIEAVSLRESLSRPARDTMPTPQRGDTAGFPRHFGFWLKIGFAFTLPLILAILVLCSLVLYLNGF